MLCGVHGYGGESWNPKIEKHWLEPLGLGTPGLHYFLVFRGVHGHGGESWNPKIEKHWFPWFTGASWGSWIWW